MDAREPVPSLFHRLQVREARLIQRRAFAGHIIRHAQRKFVGKHSRGQADRQKAEEGSGQGRQKLNKIT